MHQLGLWQRKCSHPSGLWSHLEESTKRDNGGCIPADSISWAEILIAIIQNISC